MKFTAKEKSDLETWARRAIHGLQESDVFIGILDDSPLDAARIEFTLQLGYAVLHTKMIFISVPHGVEVPPKLAAVADAIVRYTFGDPASLHAAMTTTLIEHGANRQ